MIMADSASQADRTYPTPSLDLQNRGLHAGTLGETGQQPCLLNHQLTLRGLLARNASSCACRGPMLAL